MCAGGRAARLATGVQPRARGARAALRCAFGARGGALACARGDVRARYGDVLMTAGAGGVCMARMDGAFVNGSSFKKYTRRVQGVKMKELRVSDWIH